MLVPVNVVNVTKEKDMRGRFSEHQRTFLENYKPSVVDDLMMQSLENKGSATYTADTVLQRSLVATFSAIFCQYRTTLDLTYITLC